MTSRRIQIVILLAMTIIACVLWQYRLRFPFDDTFISFRYAEHVASGHGLVWNLGGPHTEGYTNFLFVLILAACKLLTSDLLAASQAIGLAATIATGVALFVLATNLRDGKTGILAVLFYAFTPLTWINALSGMETSLFVMWIVIGLLAYNRGKLPLAYLVSFVAMLTRPEGAMLGVLILLVDTARKQTPSITLATRLKPFVLFFVLPLLLYAVWKFWYFGSFLPNSFYIKVSQSALALPGLQYVRLFVMSTLALLVASLGIRRLGAQPALFLALLWVASLIFFYIFVTPLEGLYDRFLWPAFAFLCLMAATGVSALSQRRHIRALPWGILLLHVAIMVKSPRTAQALAAHEDVWDSSMDRLVTELQLLPHCNSLTLAYGDAGYVVYKSGIGHLDLFGLNDTRIAHAKSREERARIIRDENPDLLLLPLRDSAGHSILQEDAYGLAFTGSYNPVASIVVFPLPLVLFLNRDSRWATDCVPNIQRRMTMPSAALQPAPYLTK